MIRTSLLFFVVSASMLSAATITYVATATPSTLSTGSGTGSTFVTIPLLQINQFNPALGTLNGVTLRANYTVELSGTINSGENPGELNLYLMNEISIAGYGLEQCEDGNADGNDGGVFMRMFIVCNRTTSLLPPELTDQRRAALTGLSTVNVGWPGSGSVNYLNMSTYSVTLNSGAMTVTYAYDPIPTPEPASIASSALAFALFALAARRRVRQ